MDKLKSIKIKNLDGTYTKEIPVGVSIENVDYDSQKTLKEVIGDFDYTEGTMSELIATIKGKQDVLAFDSTPTAGSQNPVTSHGIFFSEIALRNMLPVSWAELKGYRDRGTLYPGTIYKILDYICTTTQTDTRAVEHPFYILVVATSTNTLSEDAMAQSIEGDEYYANSNLAAWELKYCLDNDTNRFAWADTENGHGVIYYLKDDHGNECPYDFKQIQFARYKITACTVSSLVGKYTTSQHGDAITGIDQQNPVWCFTFSYDPESTGVMSDTSVMEFSAENKANVSQNIIKVFYDYSNLMSRTGIYVNHLNNIVLFGPICINNTFGNYCYFNTLGSYCHYNVFNHCQYNTFGDYCTGNTFGDQCTGNTFGDQCMYNTFGDQCMYNTFGSSCMYNRFRFGCGGNTFGNRCMGNTFEFCCGDMYGMGHGNAFGDLCMLNTFGSYCMNNTFGNNCGFNILGDECSYIDISGTSQQKNKRYYHIFDGVAGTQDSHLSITGTDNNDFITYVGMNSSGELKTWVPADLAPAEENQPTTEG